MSLTTQGFILLNARLYRLKVSSFGACSEGSSTVGCLPCFEAIGMWGSGSLATPTVPFTSFRPQVYTVLTSLSS